jgi:hypothetical protein
MLSEAMTTGYMLGRGVIQGSRLTCQKPSRLEIQLFADSAVSREAGEILRDSLRRIPTHKRAQALGVPPGGMGIFRIAEKYWS